MSNSKKTKRPASRAEHLAAGQKMHNQVSDTLASMLAIARENMPWDESRVRVVILVSTDHTDDSSNEALSIFTNCDTHIPCILARGIAMLENPQTPMPIIVTRH